MHYKEYAPKDSNGKNLESRKVRKASRREKFAFNKHLHSRRAKEAAKAAAAEAAAKAAAEAAAKASPETDA